MDAQVWMKVAKAPIHRYFEQATQKTYSAAELSRIFEQNRAHWRLSGVSFNEFIRLLPAHSKFSRIELPFPTRKHVSYVWGKEPPLTALLAADPKAYLSHNTALEVHGLAATPGESIYLNIEQARRRRDEPEPLEQARIDAAFKRAARVSSRVTVLQGRRVCLLSGMQTGMLGVTTAQCLDSRPQDKGGVRVTGIERTLIDIAVRPAYSGGPHQVLHAYGAAKRRTEVPVLFAMLRELNYAYPYHQAIGFCLERAGHTEADLAPFRAIPMIYDFYLSHAMERTVYIPHWRLHVPTDLA